MSHDDERERPRPLDSRHGHRPRALARDRVPSERKPSRGRPERSPAKSKVDQVGAPGSARGGPIDEEDKEYIRDLFYGEIVPKLIRLHARNGVLGCEFAGPRFSHWQIRFRFRGDDFDIVDFEYDEEGCGIDLDL